MPMPLNQFLPQAHSDLLVRELTLDSRKVLPGDLFLALPGLVTDGRTHITGAIARGAIAVAYEAENAPLMQDSETLLIPVQGLQQQLSGLAGRFYGEPSRSLDVIGVTGTNGKSSITQLLAQALTKLSYPCGVIGTLGVGFFGDLQESRFTTPDAIAVQSALAKMKSKGAKAVALEVSSHGLDQDRVTAVNFDIAVLSNLSRDHLDYHGDMTTYAEVKSRLFKWPSLKAAVINFDDALGQQLINSGFNYPIYSYSVSDTSAHIYCREIEFTHQGFKAVIVTPHGEGILTSALIGQFNLSNMLAVIGVLLAQKYSLSEILKVVPMLQGPQGRMQRLGGETKPLIVVDYAHTPDALEQVLTALRPHVGEQGKLHCVFGCGGDRDKGKRPLMARVAEQLADVVWLTDDNPRTENPQQIRSEILKGFHQPEHVHELTPRLDAVTQAITQAGIHDVVLLAGKGHEAYQEIDGVKYHYSDLEQAAISLSQWEQANV